MSLILAVFLGLLRGLTEFLPVSGSGHLALAQNIFGIENIKANHPFFDMLLYIGALISVSIVFRKDIRQILKAVVRLFSKRYGKSREQEDEADTYFSIRLLLLLAVAALPLLILIFVKDHIAILYGSTAFTGFALIVTGGLLYIGDRLLEGRRNERNAKLSGAFAVGLVQAVSVFPGLSRTGSTITSGILCDFDRSFAVKFSFLISIPVLLGAGIYSLVDAIELGINWRLVPIYMVGMAVEVLIGIVAIRIVRYLATHCRLGNISYYCWAIGIISIGLSFFI
ncbi:MAG: undecaprenyl-diphosphate phosphatase [Clostridiales bacterium]|jgi:undecaprenyl-diphosphatase|nr:undecaprenyl-diphosphate phosphatase [Clostridiales bacterium]